MAREIIDPDEVNQDAVVTTTDGAVVTLEHASRGDLDRIARQLHVYRSAYANAYEDPAYGEAVATGHARVEEHAPLFLRVAELQQRARRDRNRSAEGLDLRLLLQDRVWTSSSGSTRALREMTPSHRRNVLGFLERANAELAERALVELTPEEQLQASGGDPWVTGTPLYQRLRALIAAETELERARDEARQTIRQIEFDRTGEWPSR